MSEAPQAKAHYHKPFPGEVVLQPGKNLQQTLELEKNAPIHQEALQTAISLVDDLIEFWHLMEVCRVPSSRVAGNWFLFKAMKRWPRQ